MIDSGNMTVDVHTAYKGTNSIYTYLYTQFDKQNAVQETYVNILGRNFVSTSTSGTRIGTAR